MQPSEVRKAHLALLDVLISECQRNKLTFFLYYGSLIGAIRHQGIIPWDDDIDVAMPRKFYELLKNIEWQDRGCELIAPDTHPDSPYPFLKLADLTTRCIEDIDGAMANLGVNIDIFPIDYQHRCRIKNFCINIIISFLHFIRQIKIVRLNRNRSKIKNIFLKFAKIITFALSANKISNLIDAISFQDFGQDFAASKLGPYGRKEVIKSDNIEKTEIVEFEGRSVPIPLGYDEILRSIYGHYMVPPSVEKRVSHHAYKAFRLFSEFQ